MQIKYVIILVLIFAAAVYIAAYLFVDMLLAIGASIASHIHEKKKNKGER